MKVSKDIELRPCELTAGAIALGVAISIVFGAANAYLGLRTGMTVSASIPAAVISMAVFRALRRRGALLENNMVQTIGSAGESVAAGAVFTLPAMILWGVSPSLAEIFFIAAFGGILGVLMMIPLRHRLIVEEHATLPYPEGTACAEVLRAGEEGGVRARMVFEGLGVGAFYKVLADGLGFFPSSVSGALPVGRNAIIGMEALPSLLGLGYIIGLRIAALVFAGSVLGWLVFIPLITLVGDGLESILPPGKIPISEMGAREVWNSYLRYIGAGAVAFGGLVSLLKSVPLLWRSVRAVWRGAAAGVGKGEIRREDRDLPPKLVIAGAAALIAAIALAPAVPVGILGASLIAVFGFFFVAVTAQIVGIIGNSSCPASGMTIATLLACTALLKWAGYEGMGGRIAALSIGAVVCIAIAVAGDTSQDLKTGYLVGATPNRQQIGEIIGVLSSALFIGLTIFLLHKAYGIGSEKFPAPQANLMSVVIPGVLEGNLPWGLVFIGVGAALTVELLGVSSLPFAVGLYLPISLTTPIIVGGALHWLAVERRGDKPAGAVQTTAGTLFASGLIAGDALIGVALALLTYREISISLEKYLNLGALGTCALFATVAFLLIRVDWRGKKKSG